MSEIQEQLKRLIAEAEAKSKGKNIAEIEQLVIGYGEQIQRVLMQGLVSEGQEKREASGSKKVVQGVKKP